MTKIKITSFLLFLFSYLCILGILISLIIKYYAFFSDYEYIWFCSKILTVKKIIEKNNNQYNAFYGYNNEGNKLYITKPKTYLNYLELLEDNGCKRNYKICGILDTYGNIFCFPKDSDCPINDIIIDSPDEASKYNGYSSYNYESTGDKLYYKIGNVNSNIIVYWHINFNSFPKYIDNSNFILDKDAFYEIFGKNDDDDDDDDNDDNNDTIQIGEGVNNVVQGSANTHKFQQLINYINKKIKEEKNIDTYFKKIYYNEYVKSYIGFKSIDDIEKFNTIDFNLYKSIFPNKSAIIFSFICGIIFLISIIIFIGKVINEIKGNSNCCEKCDCIISVSSIIIYSLTFLGFFIYFLVIYAKTFNNESFVLAKSIKADIFIENFLKEFYEPFEKNNLIICSIIIFAISVISYILAWILIPIMEYCKKRNQKQNNNNNNFYLYQRNERNDYQRNIYFNHNIGTQNMNGQQIQTEIYQSTNRQLNGDETQKGENQNEDKNEDEKEIPQKENQDETIAKDNKDGITIKDNGEQIEVLKIDNK